MKQQKNNKIDAYDYETLESINRYCEIIASLTKRLTNENFKFKHQKYEKSD